MSPPRPRSKLLVRSSSPMSPSTSSPVLARRSATACTAAVTRSQEENQVPANDPFRYEGKHVLVVGGATGMGAAAAHTVTDLGARVTILDYTEVDTDAY